MRPTTRRTVRNSLATLFAAAGITAGLALPAGAAGASPATPVPGVTQQAQPKAAAQAQQLAGLQANQMWKLRKKGDKYEIANAYSDLCLKVKGGSTDNGAPVVQGECGTASENLWKSQVTDNGTFIMLRNANSNKCLSIDGGRATRGAKIVQWDCFGGGNQKWWDTDGINADQGWWISGNTPSGAPTWMCLDMPGWSTSPGTQAAMYECTS